MPMKRNGKTSGIISIIKAAIMNGLFLHFIRTLINKGMTGIFCDVF